MSRRAQKLRTLTAALHTQDWMMRLFGVSAADMREPRWQHALQQLPFLEHASAQEIAQRTDLSAKHAQRLHDAFRLSVHTASLRCSTTPIENTRDAATLADRWIGGSNTEILLLLALTARGRLIQGLEVATGGSAGLSVAPTDILRAALWHSASSIIVAHNHPSGDPRPSAEDAVFTHALHEACCAVGLLLRDHIVVGHGSYYSFRDHDRLAA